jgi:hypothetical protein
MLNGDAPIPKAARRRQIARGCFGIEDLLLERVDVFTIIEDLGKFEVPCRERKSPR